MKYIIANFKSHKTSQEIISWFAKLPTPPSGSKLIVALPYPYLSLSLPTSHASLAAQNASPFPPGSYTGEVNATQLADLKVEYCLVGHSERRRYFHETSQDVARKVNELLAAAITPIICVSEQELSPQFASLTEEAISRSLFAFETPENIGRQDTTAIAKIKQVMKLLRDYTSDSSLGLIYGGSVNPGNASSLSDLVDGILVATASLDQASFTAVIQGFTLNA